jgi:hypothetical protein
MKKEISFYEFVGILMPGSIILFGTNFILLRGTKNELFDMAKIGETVVFLVLAYATGHFVQAIANILEKPLWWIFGGMPTDWLLKPNRFKKKLFPEPLNQQICDKVTAKYGGNVTHVGRLVYNHIFLNSKTGRIDVFNGNYSLFRGLTIASLLLGIISIPHYHLNWWQGILALSPSILMLRRMIRFANYYATETFRTFYNL